MQANYSRSTNDRDALRPAVLRGGGGALAWTELPPRAMAATWPPCMHHVVFIGSTRAEGRHSPNAAE